jgi:hypothetical protein
VLRKGNEDWSVLLCTHERFIEKRDFLKSHFVCGDGSDKEKYASLITPGVKIKVKLSSVTGLACL